MILTCKTCVIAKPLSEFGKYKNRSYCNSCWLVSKRNINRVHRLRHPHKAAEYTNRWRCANRAQARAYTKKWFANNPEKARAYSLARRDRERTAGRKRYSYLVTSEKIAARAAMFGHKCWVCGGAYEQMDHVKPIAKGGKHIAANLRPICASCNHKKHAKWPVNLEAACF